MTETPKGGMEIEDKIKGSKTAAPTAAVGVIVGEAVDTKYGKHGKLERVMRLRGIIPPPEQADIM